MLTLGCWLVLGFWYGIGYCPITDWQWEVKEKLGETDLPASFIKYFVDKVTGSNWSPVLIDWITGIGFAFAVSTSVYLNVKRVRKNNIHEQKLSNGGGK